VTLIDKPIAGQRNLGNGHSEPKEREMEASAWAAIDENTTTYLLPHISQSSGPDQFPFSVAILPLCNTSLDESMEYLSDGLTESLIGSLSNLPQLNVLARSTVFQYKERQLDPIDIGRELNVRAVLSGKLNRSGEKLVVFVELADVKEGGLIWAERFEYGFSDIVGVQHDITREISKKLRIKLSSSQQQRLAKRQTNQPDAFHLYLKGRYCWNKRTPEGFRTGTELFRQAIEFDPSYALAWAGLADSYIMLGNYSALSPPEAFPMAKAAAEQALEIDEALAEARTALAYVKNSYDWDWQGAKEEFKRAIELKPGYANSHYLYAIAHLTAMGRLEEAIEEMEWAKRLDPLSLIISTNLGWIYYFARQYDRAIEQLRRTIQMDPSFNVAHYKLGQVYERQGRYEDAIEEYLQAKNLAGGNLWVIPALGHAYAKVGRLGEVYNVLAVLKGLSVQRYVSPYFLAQVYVGLGDLDKAFGWFDKAVVERSDWLVWLAVEPLLDELRAEPRFHALLTRVGLQASENSRQRSKAGSE
jgi:TolB-like protein